MNDDILFADNSYCADDELRICEEGLRVHLEVFMRDYHGDVERMLNNDARRRLLRLF